MFCEMTDTNGHCRFIAWVILTGIHARDPSRHLAVQQASASGISQRGQSYNIPSVPVDETLFMDAPQQQPPVAKMMAKRLTPSQSDQDDSTLQRVKRSLRNAFHSLRSKTARQRPTKTRPLSFEPEKMIDYRAKDALIQ